MEHGEVLILIILVQTVIIKLRDPKKSSRTYVKHNFTRITWQYL